MATFLRLLKFAILVAPFVAPAQAFVNYDPDFSIALTHPISPDGNQVPSFDMVGNPGYPQILSDRIILTPPSPGNYRTGLWSAHTNPYQDWTADVNFRATGSEHGKGSFTFWYTARGKHGIQGYESPYSSRPWDGLALTIDNSQGGHAQLRAYLNDGSRDYSIHHDVPSLAFGHCDFWYRNKGAPSHMRVTHGFRSFKVELDGNVCFETDKVRLPKGYFFGVSAASASDPDSIELFGFKLSSPEREGHENQQHFYHDDQHVGERIPDHTLEQQKQSHAEEKERQRREAAQAAYGHKMSAGNGGIPPAHERDFEHYEAEVRDAPASSFKTQQEQFTDLHNRLQALTHHLSAVQNQIGMVYDKLDSTLGQIEDFRQEARHRRVPREQVDRLEGKMADMDQKLAHLESLFTSKDIEKQFESIHNVLRDHHSNLLYAVPDSVHKVVNSGPRISFGMWILILIQISLVGGFVYYKRKKNAMPKKYL
ncbi:concanavalin A-like lectin/glucanase [Ascobolus immersus RN42]|uniref:Concanavalin A-like lectin/glucanase n=1 Tax=Ascobolus immersus RN42 TaxID=1160509 RepID=A0A3N4HYK3_ASCIM|nr:concanavalin A-like lectin/glucanase [Ascobolus immersus RN42]